MQIDQPSMFAKDTQHHLSQHAIETAQHTALAVLNMAAFCRWWRVSPRAYPHQSVQLKQCWCQKYSDCTKSSHSCNGFKSCTDSCWPYPTIGSHVPIAATDIAECIRNIAAVAAAVLDVSQGQPFQACCSSSQPPCCRPVCFICGCCQPKSCCITCSAQSWQMLQLTYKTASALRMSCSPCSYASRC